MTKAKKNTPFTGIPVLRKSDDQDRMGQALKGGADKPGLQSIGSVPSFAAAAFAQSPSGEFIVGQSYDVPLNILVASPNNARVFYRAGEVDSTAASLQSNTQLVDVLGYLKDGRVVLTDGQKRFKSALAGGLSTLRVKFIEKPIDDWKEYLNSRSINLERSDQTPLDDAVRWQEYKDRFQDQKQMADALGVSTATLNKTLGLNRIPSRLLRLMAEHDKTSSLRAAYEISCIFNQQGKTQDELEVIAEDVIDATVKNDLSVEKVQALINSKFTGPRQRAKADAMAVKFGSAGKGQYKSFPSKGKFELVLNGLNEVEIADLERRIQAALSQQMQLQ